MSRAQLAEERRFLADSSQSSSSPLSSFSLLVREDEPRHSEACRSDVATRYRVAIPTEAYRNAPRLDTGWTLGSAQVTSTPTLAKQDELEPHVPAGVATPGSSMHETRTLAKVAR
jgi:hypothetical protein